jgi:RNA polymerase sigma-70 factor (ECF subfamily)
MTPEFTAAHLEGWIAAFRGPLVGLLASWGSDWREAEELAQDVFAEAWLGRARFVGEPDHLEAAGAWLRGIAFRLHSAASKRQTQGRAASLGQLDPPAPVAEHDERRALLARVFAKLAAPQQAVLRMHYLEETSAREVAALLGLTPKAVEDRLYQARKALRALVDREVLGHEGHRGAQGVRT